MCLGRKAENNRNQQRLKEEGGKQHHHVGLGCVGFGGSDVLLSGP